MSNDPKQTEEMCDYCYMEIDTDFYGWGYFEDEFGTVFYHNECFQEVNDADVV